MKWDATAEAELRAQWTRHRGKIRAVARAMGLTKGQVDGKSRILGLQFQHTGRALIIERGSEPDRQRRTVFPTTVRQPDATTTLLKSGDNQRKIGGRVTKGSWKDYPIFCLTLQERATCPRDCALWLGCYGNNMGHAIRWRHGRALVDKLRAELGGLQRRRPHGFVVRLHVLGDFYSLGYVGFWAWALEEYPALHIFGYTHWQAGTPIGDAVAAMRDARWNRFAVRTSDASDGPRAITIQAAEDASPLGAIVCPAQNAGGKSRQCGTCALCWGTQKPIAFIQH